MKRAKNIIDKEITLKDGVIVIGSDIHIPFHDTKAVDAFISYVADTVPDIVILNGDVLDMFMLSRFTKGEGRNPLEEIEECRRLLKKIKDMVPPETELYYVIGNHETRLERYVLTKAPELASLVEDVFTIIKAEDYGFKGCASLTINDKVVIKHGTLLGNKSGLSAIKEMEASYMSGASGHCFSEDVEVLTTEGWNRIIDVDINDSVGTYRKSDGKFEFNKVEEKFVYDNYKELYHIKSSNIDVMTTDKHGFIGYDRRSTLKEFTAEELSTMGQISIPLACYRNEGKGLDISDDFIRLLVNISSDACIEDNAFRFHLKKQCKIAHLVSLLDRLGYKYSVKPQKGGTTKIRISTKDSLPIIKEYFPNGKQLPKALKEVSQEQANIILDEYSITDGCKNNLAINSYQISTSKKDEADLIQEIFVRNGIRTSVINRGARGYVITANTRTTTIINGMNCVQKVPYSGQVSCVSVKNGTLVIRSKGKTLVTQNTHRLCKYIARKAGRKFFWMETGCLCGLNPEYMVNPNWQQGFARIDIKNGKVHNAKIIEIENGEILD